MLTIWYIHTDEATFPLRHRLKETGCKWDSKAGKWWAKSKAEAEAAIALLGNAYAVDAPVDAYPKGKPRGRGFRKGYDTRRDAEAKAEAASHNGVAAATAVEDEVEAAAEATVASVQSVSVNGDTAQQLAALVRAIAGNAVNAAEVKKIVATAMLTETEKLRKDFAEMLKAGPVHTIRVELASGDAVTVKTLEGLQHQVTAKVLRKISAGLRNVLLVGPAGSGKTTLAQRLAEALGVPFGSVSCSAGMSEGTLLGRLLPTGDGGKFEYAIALFVYLYENGGVFLLDEVDAADANVLLVLNSALANGHLDIPNRLANPVAKRHPSFYLIAAGNTWGLGANRQYVGRNQLDAAFLSRFAGSVVEMPYDRVLETGIVASVLGDKAATWANRFWTIREKIDATGLRRIWGTREMANGAKLVAAGESVAEAIAELTVGWTPDEITKAGAK